MKKRVRAGIIALAIAITSVGAAHADAVLSFTPSTLSTVAGGTVEFVGILTNTGAADLYLNGDVVILPYPFLTVDDSIFYVNAPLFLSSGESYSGAFFDVTADAATPSGSYSGTYTIQGGADADTFDDIATEDFQVDVSSPIPEPNPFLFLATGLAILAAVRLTRFHVCQN